MDTAPHTPQGHHGGDHETNIVPDKTHRLDGDTNPSHTSHRLDNGIISWHTAYRLDSNIVPSHWGVVPLHWAHRHDSGHETNIAPHTDMDLEARRVTDRQPAMQRQHQRLAITLNARTQEQYTRYLKARPLAGSLKLTRTF